MAAPSGEGVVSLKYITCVATLPGGATTLVDLNELTYNYGMNTFPRTAGASHVEQTAPGERTLTMSIRGYGSDSLSIDDIPPGTEVSDFAATFDSNSASIFPAQMLTDFPLPWYLGSTQTSIGAGPSEWTTQLLTTLVAPPLS